MAASYLSKEERLKGRDANALGQLVTAYFVKTSSYRVMLVDYLTFEAVQLHKERHRLAVEQARSIEHRAYGDQYRLEAAISHAKKIENRQYDAEGHLMVMTNFETALLLDTFNQEPEFNQAALDAFIADSGTAPLPSKPLQLIM